MSQFYEPRKLTVQIRGLEGSGFPAAVFISVARERMSRDDLGIDGREASVYAFRSRARSLDASTVFFGFSFPSFFVYKGLRTVLVGGGGKNGRTLGALYGKHWRMMTRFWFLFCSLFKAHCYLMMAHCFQAGLCGKQSSRRRRNCGGRLQQWGAQLLMPI